MFDGKEKCYIRCLCAARFDEYKFIVLLLDFHVSIFTIDLIVFITIGS